MLTTISTGCASSLLSHAICHVGGRLVLIVLYVINCHECQKNVMYDIFMILCVYVC